MTELLLIAFIVAIVAAIFYTLLGVIRLSLKNLLLGVAGAIVGLLLGGLISIPLSQLPSPYGNILPLTGSLLLTIIMIVVFLNQREAIGGLMPFVSGMRDSRMTPIDSPNLPILVDTSVIIDGRIADIAKAGFVPGKLMVPRFVLAELQNIADSDDAMRRGRGRRGLEILNELGKTPGMEVEIIERDLPDVREVDAKLVALAKQLGTNILTTDFNLNRVAAFEGVRVLNINELSNAIRPVVLPGEDLQVKIVQAGKERNQGVGYLADGTMIVVENGDKLIGQDVTAEVTRVFQTVAGKMIFATPRKNQPPAANGDHLQTRKVGRKKGDQNHKPHDNSRESIEDRLIRNNH